jgi:hypothetical protein
LSQSDKNLHPTWNFDEYGRVKAKIPKESSPEAKKIHAAQTKPAVQNKRKKETGRPPV